MITIKGMLRLYVFLLFLSVERFCRVQARDYSIFSLYSRSIWKWERLNQHPLWNLLPTHEICVQDVVNVHVPPLLFLLSIDVLIFWDAAVVNAVVVNMATQGVHISHSRVPRATDDADEHRVAFELLFLTAFDWLRRHSSGHPSPLFWAWKRVLAWWESSEINWHLTVDVDATDWAQEF